MKKIFIAILIILIISAAAVFIYRYRIIQYSVENIIRGMLPPYVRIDKITFDIRSGRITLNDFKILNPPRYSDRYLLEIAEISCEYKLKGKNILDGFEVEEPYFNKMTLNIERLGDGRLNLEETNQFTSGDLRQARHQGTPSVNSSTCTSFSFWGIAWP